MAEAKIERKGAPMKRKLKDDDLADRRPILDGGTPGGRSDGDLVALLKAASPHSLNEAATRRLIARRDIIRSFGALVRDCRRARKLTQGDLAAAAGVSKSTIANIETGMLAEGPRIGTLADLLFIMNHELRPLAERRRFLEPVDSAPIEQEKKDVANPRRRGARTAFRGVLDADDCSDPRRPKGHTDVEAGTTPYF